MKPTILLIAFLSLVTPLHAKQKKKGGGMSPEQKQEQAEKQKEKAEREKTRLAVKEILDAKDKNNDGSLSLDEYLIGETDMEAAKAKFTKINVNGDRYVSRGELEKDLE
jgi:hypothetical protein